MMERMTRPEKIVSGAQTGVDRAALDVAIMSGIPHSGWVPKGRLAEDGVISDSYNVSETYSKRHHVRTKKNVLESDGTLVIARGTPTGGTALTIKYANDLGKHLLCIDLEQWKEQEAAEAIQKWLTDNRIRILNVAGPRESKSPGISRAVHFLLMRAFSKTGDSSIRERPPGGKNYKKL